MALVAYSDSEDSDLEPTSAPPSKPIRPSTKSTDKPAFQKLADPLEPRKIKVDLSTIQPEPDRKNEDEQAPPAKRARTAGAFGGFNSLLPAPKRTVQTGPKPGVSLKTSSEAAFSRAPVETIDDDGGRNEYREGSGIGGTRVEHAVEKEEPKAVGKVTRFKPLSVANKKKPMKKSRLVEEAATNNVHGDRAVLPVAQEKETVVETASPPPKPKRSLFSVSHTDEEAHVHHRTEGYESIITQPDLTEPPDPARQQQEPTPNIPPPNPNPNSLQTLASDMNLTPAQRRQLFGRNAKDTNINIAHFDMDNEYAANEQLRQAGEVVEHRAVKSIAPGKHSLQQLVNNARSQKEGLEDKWADGRRDRGEGGARYGWGR